jgi:hypothetical protein
MAHSPWREVHLDGASSFFELLSLIERLMQDGASKVFMVIVTTALVQQALICLRADCACVI